MMVVISKNVFITLSVCFQLIIPIKSLVGQKGIECTPITAYSWSENAKYIKSSMR